MKRYVGLGAEVVVASGAGLASGVGDGDYEAAGAKVVADNAAAVSGADVVLSVRRPEASCSEGANRGALAIAIMDPYGHEAELEALAKAGVSACSRWS